MPFIFEDVTFVAYGGRADRRMRMCERMQILLFKICIRGEIHPVEMPWCAGQVERRHVDDHADRLISRARRLLLRYLSHHI